MAKKTKEVIKEEDVFVDETATIENYRADLNKEFMNKVDIALDNSLKLYEQKYLTREVIQAICNSVLR